VSAFDPWRATLDEAIAQQELSDQAKGPAGPLFQWQAVESVNALRAEIEAGDGFAALDAVARCLRHDLVAPGWLARAFVAGYDKVLNCRAGSWDEAFGRPYPKRARLDTLRQRREIRGRLELFFAKPGAPSRNRDGFALAAQVLGITPRQAEEWTPRTRKNTRGHKPYGTAATGPANDPFGLTRRKQKTG
jgi:hypothetical protein